MQPIPSCAQSCARSLTRDGLSHTPGCSRRAVGIRPVVRTEVSTTSAPPHTPHAANPDNRFWAAFRGGRATSRPLLNRRGLPSASLRGVATAPNIRDSDEPAVQFDP